MECTEYLSESTQRRKTVARLGLVVYFCCLVTSNNVLFFSYSSALLVFWNLAVVSISRFASPSIVIFLSSDSIRVPTNILLAQLCILSGSPFGWIMSATITQFTYYTVINPYHSTYQVQLYQVKHWATVNIVVTLISMWLAEAPMNQIAQASLSLFVTRFIMVRIYELHSPMIYKLHHTNQEKSVFISVVSHEIRTPLTHIINNLELLEVELRDSQIFQQIQKSSELLLRLLNKILNYSKWKAQKVILDNQVVDLRSIFKNIVDQFSFDVSAKGMFLNFNVDESIDQFFLADKLKIEELFLNLVGNAVKFTHIGGVTVNMKNVETEETDQLTQKVEISVTDTGIGISEEGLRNLFQPFSQANQTISPKYGGSGLGLSICKEIVECLNGTITVESEPNMGTKMIVSILFSKASPVKEPEKSNSIPMEEVYPDLILCEDNLMIRKCVQQLLLKEGFKEVSVCCDGIELVEAFKSTLFSIVVTDQHMPRMDGGAAVKILRESYPGGRFRAILLTADVSFEKPDGVDRVLTKPTNGKDLKRAILEEYQDLLAEKKQAMIN